MIVTASLVETSLLTPVGDGDEEVCFMSIYDTPCLIPISCLSFLPLTLDEFNLSFAQHATFRHVVSINKTMKLV